MRIRLPLEKVRVLVFAVDSPAASGTPASRISSLAAAFEPMARIAAGGGPMKTMPALAQASANSAFSARNP